MTINDDIEIKIQIKKPKIKGLTPTETISSFESPDPIKNNVIFKPIFDIVTMAGATVCTPGTKVLISNASIKRKIKYGTLIFFDPSLKMKSEMTEIGIIHNALSSFIVVAICRASAPYWLAAPTTELVSCMAMAAQIPN